MVAGLLTMRLWDAPTPSEEQYEKKVGIGKSTDLQHQKHAGIGKAAAFAVMETVVDMLMRKCRDHQQPIRLEPYVRTRMVPEQVTHRL